MGTLGTDAGYVPDEVHVGGWTRWREGERLTKGDLGEWFEMCAGGGQGQGALEDCAHKEETKRKPHTPEDKRGNMNYIYNGAPAC